MKKVALHNLGCKVNAYETEAMQEILEQNGYEIVPFEKKQTLILSTPVVSRIWQTRNHARCFIVQKR